MNDVVPITGRTSRSFPFTDAGNAERLIAAHGDDFRFLVERKRWLRYDGTKWCDANRGELHRAALAVVRQIYADAAQIDDDDIRKAAIAHARASESRSRLDAMVDLARHLLPCPISATELDRDAWLFNCKNGVLDLRSGKLREHRRSDLITKIAPVVFDAMAAAPTFDRFLGEVLPDAELRAFVSRFFGYALTAATSEHVLAVFHGIGCNGKTTLLEAIRAALGDYAKNAAADAFLQKRADNSPRNDLAALAGARLVTTSETESGRRLSEAMVKSATGGDTITARFLFAEFFDFRPTFKIVLASNYKPIVSGTDDGIWRRIALVPFGVRVPDERVDRDLPTKLMGELPGILAWLVRGCMEWQRSGLATPAAVVAASRAYREESDPLGEWLEERCDLTDPTAKEATAELYGDYKRFIGKNGEPLDPQRFGELLGARGLVSSRIGHARRRGWIGVRLLGAPAQEGEQ